MTIPLEDLNAVRMRDHKVLLKKLIAASNGEKVEPVRLDGGPLNKVLMDRATALLVDWSPKNRGAFLGLLEDMREVGHMTVQGPHGVRCEQGSPGAHRAYSMGAVFAVYRVAWEEDPSLGNACEAFLLAEAGLNRHFRFQRNGHRQVRPLVVLPCPRGKDEIDQPPFDGYRDVELALMLGEKVRKPAKYWQADLALGVRILKELVDRGIWDSRLQGEARDAPVPKLYLPILRREIDGGFIAWIEDNEKARKAVGRDGLTWVRCSPEKITWGYDFEEVPES